MRGRLPAAPCVHELVPAPDPLDVLARCRRLGGAILLDSALRDDRLGRYSFVAAAPLKTHRLDVDALAPAHGTDPFTAIERDLTSFEVDAHETLPPFQGGLAGLFGYDLGRCLEALPRPVPSPFTGSDLVVGVHDWVVAFDHAQDRAWIISQGFPETEPQSRERRARSRCEEVLGCLQKPAEPPSAESREPLAPPRWGFGSHEVEGLPLLRSNFTRAEYLRVLGRAIEAIYQGEIFQVNLSQQLFYPCQIAPLELYERLRERNAAPFAAYFEPCDEPFVLVSASPERFVQVTPSGHVQTRPIKGTRRRGSRGEEDCYSRDELRESAKDRSENVMIVDLLRNDLSRVCKPGSVCVPELFRVETFPSVHHLVSVVEGDLRDGCNAVDLLRATFPGGSITGAPKIRAMEIITELEPNERGAYCGSLGYLSFTGAADTSILIRTVTASRGWFQFPVGGGIVADSSPEAEYAETLDKARGILWALG